MAACRLPCDSPPVDPGLGATRPSDWPPVGCGAKPGPVEPALARQGHRTGRWPLQRDAVRADGRLGQARSSERPLVGYNAGPGPEIRAWVQFGHRTACCPVKGKMVVGGRGLGGGALARPPADRFQSKAERRGRGQVRAGSEPGRTSRVRSDRLSFCRPAPSKFRGDSQARKASRSAGHSASITEYHAVSRLRPLTMVA